MESLTDSTPALERHVAKVWPRPDGREALIQAGHDVRTLVASPGWRAVTALLQAELEAIDRGLDGAHKALEHADYALLHGRRGGLRAVHQATAAIVSRAAASEQEIEHEDVAETADSGR